jgi:hypothetical protein
MRGDVLIRMSEARLMGEVTAFRPRDAASRPAPAGPAQILFFTGVRYQRDDPTSETPAPSSTTGQEQRGGGKRRRRG